MLRNTINRLFFNKKKKKESRQSEKDESSSESDEELRSAKRFIRNYRKKVAKLGLDYGSQHQASLSSLQSNLKDYKMYVSDLQQKPLDEEHHEKEQLRKGHKSSYIGRLFNLKSRKKEDGLRSCLTNRGLLNGLDNRGFDSHALDCLDRKHLNLNKGLASKIQDRRKDSHQNNHQDDHHSNYRPDHLASHQINTNAFSNQQLARELEQLRCRRKLNERLELENYFRQNFCNCQNRHPLRPSFSGDDHLSDHLSDQMADNLADHVTDHLTNCRLKERSQESSSQCSSSESNSSSDGPSLRRRSSGYLVDSADSLNLSYMDSEQYENDDSISEPDEPSEEDDRYLDTYTIESANTEENPISSESFTKLIKKLTYSDQMRTRLLELCEQRDALNFEQEFSKENYPTVQNLDSGTFAVTFLALDKTNNLVVLKVIRTVSKDVQSRLSQLSYSGTETFDEVYGEVMISKALSGLHATRVNRAHCFPQILYTKLVAGRVPENFRITKLKDSKPDQIKCLTLDQFYQTDRQHSPSRSTAFNDRKKFLKQEPFRLFSDSPVEYTVIAMKYVGKPIWKRLLNRQLNAQQLFGIVQQLIFGLVCAERQFSFEHRDLHISNILIKRTKKPEVDFVIDNQTYKLTTLGFRCFIVDMTFSRLTVDEQVFFKDLSTVLYKRQEIEAKKLKMQDMVYQLMRDEIGDAWHKFRPRTNLHWLIYVMKTIKDCELFKRNSDPAAQLLTDYYNRANKCHSLAELIDYIVERSAATP